MQNKMFQKDVLIRNIKDNVRMLFRKTIEEASNQEVFQVVSYAVKGVIIDQWRMNQKAFVKQDPKMIY